MLKFLSRLAVCAMSALLAGCIGFADTEGDSDRHPKVAHGTSATIIMPNQGGQVGMPAWTTAQPGAPATPGSAPHGTSNPQTANATPPSSGSGGNMTYIGGGEEDAEKHQTFESEPVFWKYVVAPFALVAYPFVKLYDVVAGAPEPGPALPSKTGAVHAPQHQVARDYERQQLEALERQLEQPNPPRAQTPATFPTRVENRLGTRESPSLSIADELAALRQQRAPRTQTTAHRSAPNSASVADQVSDTNGDGRADRWLTRRNGEIAEAAEDTDGDGRADSWAYYESGQIARRRADADRDGKVDTWSFFRDGELYRHEEDTQGQGFRTRTSYFDRGRLVRTQEDTDGDGRLDRVARFDDAQQISEVDQDTDGDGIVDMRSYYKEGRLARREVIEPDAGSQVETNPAMPLVPDVFRAHEDPQP